MAVSLDKSQPGQVDIPRERLEFISVNLSWSRRIKFGHEFDLDLSCFMLNKNGCVTCERDFVFYNNPVSECGAAIFFGDNRAGLGQNQDSEVINVDLPRLKDDIDRVVFVVSIHEAQQRHQVFGLVDDARLVIANRKNNRILADYNLAEKYAEDTALAIGEVYRSGKIWKFGTIKDQNAASLGHLAEHFGIGVACK